MGWIFLDEKKLGEEEGSEYGAEFLNHSDNAKRGHIHLIWELEKEIPKDKTRKSNLEAHKRTFYLV